MSPRFSINPPRIPKLTRERKLKHLFQRAVRRILLVRHLNRNIRRRRPSTSIEPWSKILILGHRSINTNPRIRFTPLNIPTRPNTIIQVRVCENATVQRIPGPTQSAFAHDGEGGVCGEGGRVVDINAIVVRKGSVCAFPGGDAAAAAAETEKRGLDPEGAEAVEEVGLAGDGAVVHVRVGEFADVYLLRAAISTEIEGLRQGKDLRCLGSCRIRNSRIRRLRS